MQAARNYCNSIIEIRIAHSTVSHLNSKLGIFFVVVVVVVGRALENNGKTFVMLCDQDISIRCMAKLTASEIFEREKFIVFNKTEH